MKRIFTLCVCCCLVFGLQAQGTLERIQEFKANTGADVALHDATQVANFVKLPQNRAIRFSGDLGERTNAFLTQYGAIFGIENPAEELSLKDVKRNGNNFYRYTMEQRYQGVPVFDGQLHFHFNGNEDITAVNGNFIPNIHLNATPSITAMAAGVIAVETVTEQNSRGLNAPLFVHDNSLYVFNKGLVKGINAKNHLVYRVEVRNDLDVREYLFVDAHHGTIVEQYTGMCTALFRRLYENNTGNQIWQEGNALPGALDQWQETEVVAAGHTYHLFNNAFGFDSYNGAGAEMRTINNNPAVNCPNATWNGATANYCTQTAADDVVAHEWGHAYTEYTSGLVYQNESGAMNESFSDIWGETVDLLNAYRDAGEDNGLRSSSTSCNETNRWKMGEDASAFGGAIRDMWVPECHSNPGKISSSSYFCNTADNGGVHYNSGVSNHAYALLVDGGTYNGQTVNAIGFIKAAHIFWRAQSVYLTQTSDFGVLAYALQQSCQDLLGVNLEGLSMTATPAGLSGQMITQADCDEVTKALLAVEMFMVPTGAAPCGSDFFVAPPSICGSGTAGNVLFTEDWESGVPAGWTFNQSPVNAGTWQARDWVLSSILPDGRTGSGMFGQNFNIGDCSTDFENGVISLQSPVINISSSAAAPILMTFDHHVDMESEYDGGQVHYRRNGGAWTRLPGSAFTSNGYNQTLATAGNDNPYAGQEAFSSNGVWGQSQVDLSAAGVGVAPGDNLELRWDVSTDGCNGLVGWYLDEIQIYSCSAPTGPIVSFTTSASGTAVNSTIDEPQATVDNDCLDYFETTVTVSVGTAPSQPIDVTVTTAGTATMGATADYTFAPNTFTLDASNLSQNIAVRIHDDALIEGAETIDFSYTLNTNGGNGSAGSTNQTHTLTINDDDFAPMAGVGGPILTQNFDAAPYTGWTATDGGSSTDTWVVAPNYGGTSTLNGTPFAFVDSDAAGTGVAMDEGLLTPVMNTVGATNMVLTFEQYFNIYNGAGNTVAETATVEVFDGTNWQNLATFTEAGGDIGAWGTPDQQTINIPNGYANANMQIRFTYVAEYDYWWALDNIEVTADQSTIVQSPVNTSMGDEEYLGPNAEIYFYDPNTGNIMARIKNLTNHDYGCTTVEVERAGTGSSNGWDASAANYVVDKTFQITAANPNPAGNFELSLYYTEAEIAGWEAASGLPRTDLMHTHTTNNMPTPMTADMRAYMTPTVAAYGADWTYTATYNGSDFVDFGLAKEEAAILVSPKVFLQGPLSGTLMNDDLRAGNLVPLTDPYSGTESTSTAVLAVTGAQAVIDWVQVEIRDAAGTTVLATRAALLLANGDVVDTDGTSAVRFTSVPASATAGVNYHIAIQHRNHLAVMTGTAIPLN